LSGNAIVDILESSRIVLHRGREATDRLAEQAVQPEGEGSKRPPTPHQREHMIAVAAYYRAQRRNFDPGHELEDWLEAEAELNARLEAR
jgi:hypothetical protein